MLVGLSGNSCGGNGTKRLSGAVDRKIAFCRNESRMEYLPETSFQSLINLGLFTPKEFESVIAAEYVDGYSKFFDGYNPPHFKSCRAPYT